MARSQSRNPAGAVTKHDPAKATDDLSKIVRGTDIESEIEERLGDLKAIAPDEGIVPSAASEQDLRRFIKSRVMKRRPYLFLLENGNFRALWKNESFEQVALQFLGGREVQYVIFGRRPDTFVQSSGRDNLGGIERLIDALDSRALIEA
jgi:hypothetical protein